MRQKNVFKFFFPSNNDKQFDRIKMILIFKLFLQNFHFGKN